MNKKIIDIEKNIEKLSNDPTWLMKRIELLKIRLDKTGDIFYWEEIERLYDRTQNLLDKKYNMGGFRLSERKQRMKEFYQAIDEIREQTEKGFKKIDNYLKSGEAYYLAEYEYMYYAIWRVRFIKAIECFEKAQVILETVFVTDIKDWGVVNEYFKKGIQYLVVNSGVIFPED